MPDGSYREVEQKLLDVLKERGFNEFTEPQRIGIPEILKDHNVLLTSPTGSGKTEAAVLPVFFKLSQMKEKIQGFGAIYITPLRALNRDVLSRIEFYAESFGLKAGVRGRINMQMIKNHVEDFASSTVYLCGGIKFVKDIVEELKSEGIKDEQIKRDIWGE